MCPIGHRSMLVELLFNTLRMLWLVQFQLTINLVALVVAFVAAVTTGEMPLNVLQLLWVNLIMDALAALGNCSPHSLKLMPANALKLSLM